MGCHHELWRRHGGGLWAKSHGRSGGTAEAVMTSGCRKIAAILAFSGAPGRESLNGRLLDEAVELIAELGTDVSVLDLRDLELPLYDPDMEPRDWPRGVRSFRQLLSAHDGLVISTPEYNGSLPPLLKNALDWSAMATGGSSGFAPHRGKVAAIMTATAGETPPTCCLDHLRAVLSALGVMVLADEVAIGSAGSALDALRGSPLYVLLRRQMETLVCELRASRIRIDRP